MRRPIRKFRHKRDVEDVVIVALDRIPSELLAVDRLSSLLVVDANRITIIGDGLETAFSRLVAVAGGLLLQGSNRVMSIRRKRN